MNAPGGRLLAVSSAVLFGCATVAAKALLGDVEPTVLAGLLYLGSGAGLGAAALAARLTPGGRRFSTGLSGRDAPWLAGAVVSGGMAAPVLLMWGLSRTSASAASLMLNLEGVLTVLIAGALFRENIGGRIAAGLALVIAGAALISAAPGAGGGSGSAGPAGGAAIAGACLLWALDNNLTRRISAGNPVVIAGIKGLAAGSVNLAASALLGMSLPDAGTAAIAGLAGFLGYGASLVLFIMALREAGAARTGALFSTAPFIGAGASLLILGEPAGPMLLPAAALMAAGVWLQSGERHIHAHAHGSLFHEHSHVHDVHHAHAHDGAEPAGERHCHPHQHEPFEHTHAHLPDIHHRHGHGR